jgi:hypothetical protein
MVAIYDLIIVLIYGVDQSVSDFLQYSGFHSVMFTYMIGFVSGHVFNYTKITRKSPKYRMTTIGLCTTILVIAAGLYDVIAIWNIEYFSISHWLPFHKSYYPSIIFVFGFVCGPILGHMEPKISK